MTTTRLWDKHFRLLATIEGDDPVIVTVDDENGDRTIGELGVVAYEGVTDHG